MKRFIFSLAAALTLLAAANAAYADFGCGACDKHACAPAGAKWSFWARANSCAPTADCDEARWQKFWHDYYRALGAYYKRLDRLDWVVYYKFHGYQTGGGQCAPMGPGGGQCGAGCGYYQAKPQYAPVFVQPQMNWGVAGSSCGQQGCQPAGWNAAWPQR